MRKVEYDYEPEAWEFIDDKGKKIDLIAEPKKVSDQQFYNFLEKDRILTQEEAIKLN